ncbi:MAG: DUF1223 domain-containing protein [Litorimonas sp.]
MKHLLLPLATLTLASFATSAMASDVAAKPTHVVELFTSQGCSSCPPANRFVTKLSENPDTLVLSYGVTYWDYLGWTDTFGDPEFTQRQRDYRDAFGAANIYTPQIVLGGSAHSPRYSKRDVADMSLPENDIDLSLTRSGDTLTVEANTSKDIIVDVVSFMPGEQSVKVKRGENGGRTLRLTNVVTDVQSLDWNGQTASVTLPKSDTTQYAVLVHDKESAKILDAAVID